MSSTPTFKVSLQWVTITNQTLQTSLRQTFLKTLQNTFLVNTLCKSIFLHDSLLFNQNVTRCRITHASTKAYEPCVPRHTHERQENKCQQTNVIKHFFVGRFLTHHPFNKNSLVQAVYRFLSLSCQHHQPSDKYRHFVTSALSQLLFRSCQDAVRDEINKFYSI